MIEALTISHYLCFLATSCKVEFSCIARCERWSTAIPRLSFLKRLSSSSDSMSSISTSSFTNSYLAWSLRHRTQRVCTTPPLLAHYTTAQSNKSALHCTLQSVKTQTWANKYSKDVISSRGEPVWSVADLRAYRNTVGAFSSSPCQFRK